MRQGTVRHEASFGCDSAESLECLVRIVITRYTGVQEFDHLQPFACVPAVSPRERENSPDR